MKQRKTATDIGVSAFILIVATGVCIVLSHLVEDSDSAVTMIFVLAIGLISRVTAGIFFGVAASFLGVMIVNYIFTFPYFAFNWTLSGYPLTFIVMLLVSLMISTLTAQLKKQEHIRREAEKERTRADLLRAISHDIRTPLTTIAGASSILLQQNVTPQEQRELVQDIYDDAADLIRLVENILSVTRFRSAGAAIQKSDEVAEDILGAAIAKFKRSYPQIQLTVTAPDDLIIVPMDAVLIEQVLLNFLENAVIHGKTTAQIQLRLSVEDGSAVFEVRDDGVGIDPNRLKTIFEGKLETPSAQPVDAKRNMGIGLSVCSSIIQAHGGTIGARNHPAGGAVFTFTLPTGEDETWKSKIES